MIHKNMSINDELEYGIYVQYLQYFMKILEKNILRYT